MPKQIETWTSQSNNIIKIRIIQENLKYSFEYRDRYSPYFNTFTDY